MNKSGKKPEKKLRVGWFTFTCSEDSTIMFTELLNDHWLEWKQILNFRHARVLQSKNVMDKMDVAFIEGAIVSEAQAKKLKKIRKLTTKLVAIGSCATTGFPSAQRNQFDAKQKEEIRYLLTKFHQAKKVRTVKDVVPIDGEVVGCPMHMDVFVKIFNKTLKDFGIKPKTTVKKTK